jgi:methionine-S-sulfoxide reductase
LGHYFGKGEGYCINASALNFIPKEQDGSSASSSNENHRTAVPMVGPTSWRKLDFKMDRNPSPSLQLLKDVLDKHITSETIVLGAGCFWHVEFALRRLPGVILTHVGYAGGTTDAPTYAQVCDTDTGHAEVVQVTFDPHILTPRVLMDCFLTLHDPTKVRAHGKHAAGTGQYRSCVFVITAELEQIAQEAIHDCKVQLGKDLSTEVRRMEVDLSRWFWRAEEYHQRHDERREDRSDVTDVSTLSPEKWLSQYGKRSPSVLGSSETMVTSSTSLP